MKEEAVIAHRILSPSLSWAMMAPQPKRVFELISGSVFILVMFYVYYIVDYPKNVPYPSMNNPSQGAPSNLILESEKLPRPLIVPVTSDKERCLPYLKDLRVKAVPQGDCHQPYVTVNKAGRLGNNMCQYASLYLLRHIFGVRVAIKNSMKKLLSHMMQNISLPLQGSNCFTDLPTRIHYETLYMKLYKAASQAKENNVTAEPKLNVSYYIYNFPQPRHILLAHRDLVRSLFRFKDEIVKQAIDNINKALEPFNATFHDRKFPVITVHVRRTDYVGHLKLHYRMKQLDEYYYIRAIEFYKIRLRRPVFLVISDDPAWCKQKLETEDVVVVASAQRTVDMALMSLGDHHITSYGTFSFNSALLGRGHITHPIGHNTKYKLVDCVHFPFFHHISNDPTYEVDNSNVVLS